MYVYKENDLTAAQYKTLSLGRPIMETALAQQALQNADLKWLNEAADIHRSVFGGPRINTQSGANILFMFKQLLQKITKYEQKEIPAAAVAEISRPTEGRTTERIKIYPKRR